jgi:hypothetical protein
MNVRKGIGGLEFVFLGIRSKEMMKESSDFKRSCGGSHLS